MSDQDDIPAFADRRLTAEQRSDAWADLNIMKNQIAIMEALQMLLLTVNMPDSNTLGGYQMLSSRIKVTSKIVDGEKS